jgi:hypothetical protein
MFENNITCTINYNHRVTATLHITEVWFVSGMTINTMQKGEEKNINYHHPLRCDNSLPN